MESDSAIASTTEALAFVMSRHGHSMNARIRQALAAAGLSPRHGMILMRLSKTGTISQQGLIEFLGIDPSALVAILNDLESDGLVARRRDPADRRRHIVELTEAGATSVCAVERTVAEVERESFADLTADEVCQLRSLLERVRVRHENSCDE